MWSRELPAVAGCAYLNAGTNGPLPLAAARAMAEQCALACDRPRITRPVFEEMTALRERARAAAARAVGAPPAEVTLTSSTTAGVGAVLAGLDWRAGDRVVTTTEEHPGVTGPLRMLAGRFGVEVAAVPAAGLADAATPGTRMLVFSHALWTTGEVLPAARIAEAARAVGAQVLLDGAQSAGAIPLGVPATGADYYAFSGQKWLLGPNGSGALWVSPRRLDELWPATPGYLTYVEGDVTRMRPDAGRFDPGTLDMVTMAGFAAALEWVDGLPGGRARWLARRAERTEAFARALAGVPGVGVVDVPERAGLIALRLPGGAEPSAVTAALAERSVLVRSIPNTLYLRVSVGPWNGDDDLERLTDGLRAALAG
jgi:L-cysteine/cystine lyase